MVVMRVMSDNRSSNCLKKYRIFFVFGVFSLCAQVYLAYVFLALDNGDQHLARQRTDEVMSKHNLSTLFSLPVRKQSFD